MSNAVFGHVAVRRRLGLIVTAADDGDGHRQLVCVNRWGLIMSSVCCGDNVICVEEKLLLHNVCVSIFVWHRCRSIACIMRKTLYAHMIAVE